MPFPLPDNATTASRYPPDLTLKHVQVIHRHGQRTPAHKYFGHIQPAGTWLRCHLAPQLAAFHSFADSLLGHHSNSSTGTTNATAAALPHFAKIVFDDPKSTTSATSTAKSLASYPRDGSCIMGQLTDTGKGTMARAGANLRALYISRLKFLSDPDPTATDSTAAFHSNVYLRSTDYARTIESLQYLIHGLFPPGAPAAPPLTLHVRSAGSESLYPQHNCSELNRLSNEFRARMRDTHAAETAAGLELVKHLGTDATSRAGLMQLHAIYDIAACMRGGNIALPEGLGEKEFDELEKITTKQWIGLYEKDERIQSLGVGRLLGDLKEKMMQVVEKDPEAVKMAVFSAHDTTIGPLLCALKAWDHQYPDFASMINLELFEETPRAPSRWSSWQWPWASKPKPSEAEAASQPPKGNNHYVRALYNGTPLVLPFCAAKGDHRASDASLCTLDAFMKRVDELVPKAYEKECQTEGGFVKFNWKY
ncbi:histidine phosphatase superfamily [Geranomyces variabilis]|nr:histidine phosphatase superfamily [Geranomyces variabilis]KAJ3139500.1 hypothetical protein HDU90_009001 [Geranomyces variabilis]